MTDYIKKASEGAYEENFDFKLIIVNNKYYAFPDKHLLHKPSLATSLIII